MEVVWRLVQRIRDVKSWLAGNTNMYYQYQYALCGQRSRGCVVKHVGKHFQYTLLIGVSYLALTLDIRLQVGDFFVFIMSI